MVIAKSNTPTKISREDLSKTASKSNSPTLASKSNLQNKIAINKPKENLDTSRFRYNQVPVETPNGVLTEFTLPNSESYIANLIEVFVNGNQKIKGTEWQEKSGDATKIQFIGSLSTSPIESDEKITFNYIKS